MSALLFNCASEHVIRKVPKKSRSLELKGTHQLVVCTSDLNIPSKNINTVKRWGGGLLEACTEVNIKVNTDRTKCIIVSCQQNGGGTSFNDC